MPGKNDKKTKDPMGVLPLYNKLTDIPSRVRFIADLKKNLLARENAKQKITKEEFEFADKLEEIFFDKYILKGTMEQRRCVFETIGKLKAENNYKAHFEYKKQLRRIPADDPKREEKARWLTDQTAVGTENEVLNNMSTTAEMTLYNDDDIRDQIFVDANITDATTMEEFAVMCGVRKENIPIFLRENKAKAEENLVEHFTEINPKSKNIAFQIAYFLMEAIAKLWLGNAMRDYYASKKLSPSERKTLDSIAAGSVKQKKYAGLKDWISKSGNRMIREDKLRGIGECTVNFYEKYRDGIPAADADEYRREEEYRNIYNNLKTLEEKLEFLADLTVLSRGKNKKYGESLHFESLSDELREEFFRDYIRNGTAETADRVLTCIGKMSTDYLLRLREDDEKMREEFEAEGENGIKKAANLSKHTKNATYSFVLRDIASECAIELGMVTSNARNDLLLKYNVNKDMTALEYARNTGKSENDIDAYLKSIGAKPDDKMLDIARAKNGGGTDEMALVVLNADFIRDYANEKRAKAGKVLLDSSALEGEKLEHFYTVRDNISGEISEEGIEDWIKNEGGKKMEAVALDESRSVINDFTKKYDKTVGYDQYIRLHTGSDIKDSDNEKRADCLAKAVAASVLKNIDSEYDLKQIHSLADSLKQNDAFINMVGDPAVVSKALTDADAIEDFRNEFYGRNLGLTPGTGKQYVEQMNILFNKMLPSDGRSREYRAFYNAVKKISDLKGVYDETRPADRATRERLIGKLNVGLFYTAQEYMRGKEKVRTTTDGKARFDSALDAIGLLSVFAPGTQKRAEKIVKQINSKRNAKEDSEKYISLSEHTVEVRIPVKEPAYIKKTEAHIARLKEGKYEDDPDGNKLLTDGVCALVGQMVRATGGAVLFDRITLEPITFEQYLDRCIEDGITLSLKKGGNNMSPKEIIARVTDFDYLERMAAVSSENMDKHNRAKVEKPLKGDDAIKYMLGSFAKDMEKAGKDLDGIYNESGNVTDTAEDRIKNMMKLKPEEFREKLKAVMDSVDSYLSTNSLSKTPRKVSKIMRLESFRRKLADYSREIEAIEKGGTHFVHEPKLGMQTRGEKISYPDLKKNLLLFAYNMAEKAEEGKSFLFRYDPESFQPGAFGVDKKPGKPAKELADVFTAMKEFRKLFKADKDGNVPVISFDIIKEKVTNIYKAAIICKASMQGKKADEVIALSIDAVIDSNRDAIRNIELLQPYMDMEIPEGRIGDKNIYDVTKSMAKPYCNTIYIAAESNMIEPGLGSQRRDSAAKKAWVDSKNELGKAHLMQKAFSKAMLLRTKIYITNMTLNGDDLYMNPVDPSISEESRAERKIRMLEIAARDIFIKLADDANIWLDLNKAADKQEDIEDMLFKEIGKKALADNPAFLNVHEGATYSNIAEKVLSEAKRLGTLDKLKADLSPKKLIEELAAKKTKNMEKKTEAGSVKKS